MYARDTTPRDVPQPSGDDTASLERQVRVLQERLAFYEGFDQLIQDNVAHARELFRLAAVERESAAEAASRSARASGEREAALRRELEAIAADVDGLARTVNALRGRVSRALGDPIDGWVTAEASVESYSSAVVIHAVPSARTALSLQRFVASLPDVLEVTAREFAGGVLHLEIRANAPLHVEQFHAWEDPRRIEALTERPDVIEFALRPANVERLRA